ncbi:heavy metal translocating P-type ATPase [Chitinophaga rhizophila]|uniref:Heavy metal translocating P-type ATPase metal-binding domain-containing protein n=1 Tax=Chitinophaga rhizophila TaxID=2866212 RepID=A0ABS7GHB8_9BACT|nr:heavy metal translocating P-type ATPase metal-binding domain-containing protein [Chitinophaga rhizophila]MBW8686042.1 heavy metal translocating P-type ATPase metal-binding domain-containing protein [Chitinophaga rhizophila]
MATTTVIPDTRLQCTHCGEDCPDDKIVLETNHFCCEGCKLVYEILNENGLCDYYTLNNNPGQSQRIPVRKDKFAFLDDRKIQQQLIQFQDDNQTHITFYIPHIHCSSCLWLLENLHRLDAGVQRVTVNFSRKETFIVFRQQETTLRRIAEILTSIGYEPYISLQDLGQKKPRIQRDLVYRLGVAGFCFGNIMLLSFPEYFSSYGYSDEKMNHLFRWMNLTLSLPVFFYSAQVFFRSAWGGIKTGFLNIDVPIVLAIIVTFIRSLTDVFSGAGAGYFDSMTGIVFFMLIGRILQDKTYQGLSFDRDYTAYFPIAVSVLKSGEEIPTALPDIRTNDTLLIHNQELIPADGILVKGNAVIDYSFVTGEAVPVHKNTGEIVYAGGKQLEGNIEILTIKEVAQSYLTSLWNRDELRSPEEKAPSFIHMLSRYFTWVVLSVAVIAATYWWANDPSRIWPAVTAVLIIACPCALLLAASFTNGHILRILSRQHLYLRNADAIERLAAIDHIVFDKTGTLTGKAKATISYEGDTLSPEKLIAIGTLAAQSSHPLSKMVAAFCGKDERLPVRNFRSIEANGISGWVEYNFIQLGNATFTGAVNKPHTDGSTVYVTIDGQPAGRFIIRHQYREGIQELLQQLQQRYKLSLLSGDNDAEGNYLQQIMGPGASLHFAQQPADKLNYVITLQRQGHHVLMIGDGLNDAGALKQSDVGISLTESSNNFTPASDGILEAAQLVQLPRLIRTCTNNRRIIIITFIISLLYNFIGLFFAVQGILSPLTAAILMPASSISIVLLTYALSEWMNRS